MQCPKCRAMLKGVDYEGVHIEVCPDCGGDFLDAGELGAIVEARDRRFSADECRAVAEATKIAHIDVKDMDRHVVCPKCGAKTNPSVYGDDSGLIIDKCSNCGGVWIDGGELEKIQEMVEGWDDELPEDLKKYGPKLRQVAATERVTEFVKISHFHFINAMINGILDVLGD